MTNKKIIERILTRDEIVKKIQYNINILLDIIPEIKEMINFPHNHPHHHLDVWQHTLLALKLSPNNFEIRLCLLLHDIGKPHSYQDGDVRHFKGHPEVSSIMARNILKRLDYDIDLIEEVCYLIEKHDSPITEEDIISNSELEYKRFKIQYCDALAHNPDKLEKRIKYLKDTKLLFRELDKHNIKIK